MHEHQGTGGHQHGPSFAQLVAAQARYHQQLVADSTAALPGPSAPPSPVEGVGVGGLSDLVALRLLHRDPWLSAMLETQPRLHAHSLSVRGVLSWARGLPGGLYQTVRHPWRSLGELSRWIADYVTLSVWPDAVGVSGPLAPLVAAATLAGWLLWETAEHTIGGAWGWCTGPLNPALALPIAVATIGGVRKKLTDPWLSGARWAAITDDLLHPLRVTTSDGALRRASLAKSYGPGSGHGEVEALLGMGAVVPLLHRWGLIQPASQAGSPAGTEPGGSLLSQATALLAPDRPREDRLRSARTLAQDLTLLNRTLKLTVLAGKTEGQLTSAQARVLATARGRLLGTTRQLAYELEVTGRLDAEVLDEVWSQRRVALADGLGALLAANQALVDSLFAASQSAPTDTQPVQAPDELIERAAAAAKALRDRPRPRSAPDEPCVAGAPC